MFVSGLHWVASGLILLQALVEWKGGRYCRFIKVRSFLSFRVYTGRFSRSPIAVF